MDSCSSDDHIAGKYTQMDIASWYKVCPMPNDIMKLNVFFSDYWLVVCYISGPRCSKQR